jgi:Uma2 family endonuclease
MSALPSFTRWRVTVDQYHKMAAAGVFAPEDRVELIDGDIVIMAPIGSRHADIADFLNEELVLALNRRAKVGPGHPLTLGKNSEPQPDLLVMKHRRYRNAHPRAEDVLLAIEVSDSSIALDQDPKRDLYARHGIAECWVVDVAGSQVWTYRSPRGGAFQDVRALHVGEILSPQSFPDIQIPVADMFA